MYLIPNSRIQIANVMFEGVHSIEINNSVKDLSNNATITLPRNFKRKEGRGVTDVIKKGDVVTIYCGYNQKDHIEFTGYVDSIGSSTPLIIECDGMWYPHKKNELVAKTFEDNTLKQILQYVFQGYSIDCPGVNVGEFIIGKVSSYTVVEALQKSLGFYCKLDEEKKTIYCYYPYSAEKIEMHTYVFGTRDADELEKLRLRGLYPNIKKVGDLKFERKDGNKVQIEARCRLKSGEILTTKVGSTADDADKRTRNYDSDKNTIEKLKEAALVDLNLMVYDGYTGSVTGFGYPRVNAGDTILIVDSENAEREGSYLCEQVKIKYSVSSGYERECKISYKV